MKKMTEEDIRKVQLDLLEHIDTVCRENNIEYSLGGGSLLGSIRHKGFIPWDDDIDIMLFRPDYDKLVEVLGKDTNSDYTLQNYKISKTLVSYSKLYNNKTVTTGKLDRTFDDMGVYIDIFPMDRLPEDENERLEFMKSVQKEAENLISTSFPAFVSGSKAMYAAARLFLRAPRFMLYHGKWDDQSIKLDELMQKYNNQSVPYIGFTDSRYRKKEYFPKEVFEEYEDTPFEQLTVRKVKEHDTYLRQLYSSNYMELPPENERENHDYYTWYWKE